MRVTINKYISREIFSIFLVTLSIFIFIIMATRMMGITELLINQRVNPGQVLKIILCLLPRVIIYSLPATCLMFVLLTFLRLSSDNEVIAFNSSGISLFQMLQPVIFFSLIIYFVASFFALYGVPWGNRAYKEVVFRLIESKADVAVKERVFCEPFDDVIFYVNSFSSREKTMKDLFVVDKRSKPSNTIVAKRGKILPNPASGMVTVLFIDGTIFTVDKDFQKARTIKFDTYDLNIDLNDIMSSIVSREKEPKEMSIGALIHNLKITPGNKLRNNQMSIKLFEMFSIPMAIFLMGIIGAPLGAHIRASGRTKGIFISLLISLVFYICLMSVRYLCEMEVLSPSIGTWIPNLFLVITCIYLLDRAGNDRPIINFSKLSFRHVFTQRSTFTKADDQEIEQVDSIEYIGSLKAGKFHLHDCRWVERISPINRISFRSIQEATDRGYIPCETCKPS
ncbi:MAG: LptF/LptG family permease [Deltaproteobacteria bacterium]|nr:LptF/LptG family permease [Deltaproteobacteria bacterium]